MDGSHQKKNTDLTKHTTLRFPLFAKKLLPKKDRHIISSIPPSTFLGFFYCFKFALLFARRKRGQGQKQHMRKRREGKELGVGIKRKIGEGAWKDIRALLGA